MYLETQIAFGYYNYLSERWDGMQGVYLGKDYSLMPYLFNLNKDSIPDQKYILFIMKQIDSVVGEDIRQKQKANRKPR